MKENCMKMSNSDEAGGLEKAEGTGMELKSERRVLERSTTALAETSRKED